MAVAVAVAVAAAEEEEVEVEPRTATIGIGSVVAFDGMALASISQRGMSAIKRAVSAGINVACSGRNDSSISVTSSALPPQLATLVTMYSLIVSSIEAAQSLACKKRVSSMESDCSVEESVAVIVSGRGGRGKRYNNQAIKQQASSNGRNEVRTGE